MQIILGHLGEGLPFLLPRLEHRLNKQKDGAGLGAARRLFSASAEQTARTGTWQ